MNLKRIAYIVALVFVLALVAQWAVFATTATQPTEKQTSKMTTPKAGHMPSKAAKIPAKKGATTATALQEVKVKLTDEGVTLDASTVKAGKVRFVARNSGKTAVPLEVKGSGFDQKTLDIQPGKQRQMTVELKRGRYDVYAAGRGLGKRGAKATLTVR